MKLYRLIIRLLKIFSHLYFVEIHALNPERIPKSGPLILAANHPTSILDAILLAMKTPRQIHFLAKSTLFKNRWIGALLRHVGAIPVYRAQEVESHGERNIEVFEKVYELFEAGGCLGLFPEGQNSPAGKVGQLRTGGARMALGAETRNQYQLGLAIIPVGINYENRGLFMSSVLLRFGRPIPAADYRETHQLNSTEAVRRLTADLQAALRRQATHVEDYQIRNLAGDLTEALGHRLAPPAAEDMENENRPKPRSRIKRWVWKLLDWYRPETRDERISRNSLEIRLQDHKKLATILARTAKHDPAKISALRLHVDRYLDHLHQTELSRALKRSLDEPVRERLIRLRRTIYVLVMAPVALFGLAHNLVPYLAARYAARFPRDEAIQAFTCFGVGFLAFTAAYGGFGFWLWHSVGMNWKWMLAYIALLPPAGYAALRYRRDILVYRDKILLRSFFWNNQELFQLLRRERQDLLERLQETTAQFDV